MLRAGAFLALLALCAARFTPPVNAQALPSVPGADCARVFELGIDRQLNMRAGLILNSCGRDRGGPA
jgi:hypothetical protein